MSRASMSPAGVGASPSIIARALPSPLSPGSPYSWEEMDESYDPNDDLLERFMANMGPGTGTVRRSPAVLNTPPAGAGVPVTTSTPIPGATVAGVGTFNTRNVPGRSTTPPGQGYLSAAAQGKRPVVAHKTPRTRPTTSGKQPRRVPRQNTPSTPSDPESRRRSSASGSSRRSSGRGG